MSAMAMPVKMLEALACARPILLGVDGEARRIAVGSRAALYVEPENADALVSAIRYLRGHPDRARSMGRQGRILAEKQFDYDLLTECLDMHLARLLGTASSATQWEREPEAEEERLSIDERITEKHPVPLTKTKGSV